MKITTVIERPDGGADVMLEDIQPHELQALLQAGFVSMVEAYAKKLEDKKSTPAIFRGDKGERK
mgnify:CR=1 FL=1